MEIIAYLLDKAKHFTFEQWAFLVGILAVIAAAHYVSQLVDRDDRGM